MSGRHLVTGFLVLLAVASAVAVVLVQHERRNLFVELRGLEKQRDRMEIEWDRLHLERSALTANDQVVDVARRELNMEVPPAASVVLVTP